MTTQRTIEVLGPELQPLSQTVDQISNDPRVRILAHSANRYVHYAGEDSPASELEAAKGLLYFFEQAANEASLGSDKLSGHIGQMATRFLAESRIITHRDRLEAISALVDSHAQFLLSNPEKSIRLFAPEDEERVKSQAILAHEAVGIFQSKYPDIKGRYSVERFRNLPITENAKYILLDDWIVTGKQMHWSIMEHLWRGQLKPPLASRNTDTEINLLVIRKDQLGLDGMKLLSLAELKSDTADSIPVKAYFQAPEFAPYGGPMPSGSHSTVDYGFSSQIKRMRDYLAMRAANHRLIMPYLANIAAPMTIADFGRITGRRLLRPATDNSLSSL